MPERGKAGTIISSADLSLGQICICDIEFGREPVDLNLLIHKVLVRYSAFKELCPA